jgi:hypothetical protein
LYECISASYLVCLMFVYFGYPHVPYLICSLSSGPPLSCTTRRKELFMNYSANSAFFIRSKRHFRAFWLSGTGTRLALTMPTSLPRSPVTTHVRLPLFTFPLTPQNSQASLPDPHWGLFETESQHARPYPAVRRRLSGTEADLIPPSLEVYQQQERTLSTNITVPTDAMRF